MQMNRVWLLPLFWMSVFRISRPYSGAQCADEMAATSFRLLSATIWAAAAVLVLMFTFHCLFSVRKLEH